MKGQSIKSKVSKKTYYGQDFDFNTDPWLPSLDITKHIKVLGDYFSENESDERTITTFRMYADYETFIKDAYYDSKSYFNSQCNKKVNCVVDTCAAYTKNYAKNGTYN